MITMTDAAKAKFLEITGAEGREGQGLRVIVRGGRSANPEFALNFVDPDEARDDDTIYDLGELKIYVETPTVEFLEGATIDFVETLTESGFKVDAPNAGIRGPEGPVADAVQEVLREQINPAIAAHGGQVSLVGIDGRTAFLRFGGGCQGCGMIDVTLKQGVERTIVETVAEIDEVRDITDHAAGTNPYYQQQG